MLTMFLGLSLSLNLTTIGLCFWLVGRVQARDKIIKIYSDSREWYRGELFLTFFKYIDKLECNQAEEVEKFMRRVEAERDECIQKNNEVCGSSTACKEED